MGDYKMIQGYIGDFSLWLKPAEETWDGQPFPKRVFQSIPKHLKSYYGEPNNKHLQPRLFNLRDDPNETNDLAQVMPERVKKMQNRLMEYKKEMVPADYPEP